MNKKTIAYVLIGIVALAGIYYLVAGRTGGSSLDSGNSTPTDPFDIDDTAAYNQLRNLIPKKDWGWMDDLVKEKYEYDPGTIGSYVSKAQTYQLVISSSAPNSNGKFPAASWTNGKPVLWPHDTYTKMWAIINNLSAKYNTL